MQMQETLIKRNVSLTILLLINFMFLLKYLSRYTEYYVFITIFVVIIQFVLIYFNSEVYKIIKKIKIPPLLIFVCFSVIFVIIANRIPLDSLKIDRWSVITSFWDNYFNDLYVYKAKSFDGNYPGPMPFYFLIMFPFYLLGEFSYITVIGVFLFLLLFKNKVDKSIIVTIVFSSFFIIYEILARSNIFFNSTLVLISLLYFSNKNKNLLLKGLVIGLLLSTRNIFIIVYGVAFIYAFKKKEKSFYELFYIGIIAVFVFMLTFLPFIYNYFNDFLEINPFIIQSSALLPFKYSVLCVVFSLLLSLFIGKKNDVYFLSGLTLFLTIAVYFVYNFIERGFTVAFFGSYADITYFIFCVPFFLFFYLKSKNPEQVGN